MWFLKTPHETCGRFFFQSVAPPLVIPVTQRTWAFGSIWRQIELNRRNVLLRLRTKMIKMANVFHSVLPARLMINMTALLTFVGIQIQNIRQFSKHCWSLWTLLRLLFGLLASNFCRQVSARFTKLESRTRGWVICEINESELTVFSSNLYLLC